MKKEKAFELHKKINGPKWYLRPIEIVGAWIFAGPFGTRTKIKKINCEGLKGPYILLSNHASFVDFANVIKSGPTQKYCWVASIEEFNGREWLMRGVGCIPKRKFTKDTILIRNCYKALHELKCNVVIYPEARFALAGINEDIGKALGKFAKVCKVPVVVMNQKGTFLRSPQWCKHPYRKIQCEVDYIQVATKEEVLTLSAEEIQERIEDAFIWDDYKWQYDNKIKITDKDRATNIHKILYKCPCCNAEQQIVSYDHFVECKACSAKWDMDEYSRMNLTNEDKSWDSSLAHVPNWYKWQRDMVNEEVENGTYVFEDKVRIERLINSKKGFGRIGEGIMRQDEKGILIKGTLDDGNHFEVFKPANTTASLHIEYNYKKRGDAIDIATETDTYFVYPLTNPNVLTKLHFATEAIFRKATEKENE